MATAQVRRVMPIAVSLTFVLAACGSDSELGANAESSSAVASSATPVDSTVDSPTTIGADPVTSDRTTNPPTTGSTENEPVETAGMATTMERLAAIAIADAASRCGVDPAVIRVVSATAVTWRDGAAGCPVKDMQYTQVMTPGSLIVLDVDGTNRQYHTGGRRSDPFYCAQPESPSSTE